MSIIGDLTLNVVKRIKNDKLKIKLIDRFEDENDKVELINSIESEQSRVQLVDKIQNDYLKTRIIKQITNSQLKIESIDKIREDSYRAEIVENIEDEKMRLQAMDKILEDRNKIDIAKSMSDLEVKIQALEKIGIVDYKMMVIKDIKDDNAKLQIIDGLNDDELSVEIAKTIEETEVKLQIIDRVKSLGNKKAIARTIVDDNIRKTTINNIEDTERLQGLDKIEDENEILEIAQTIVDDKIKIDLMDRLSNEQLKAKLAISIEDLESRLDAIDKLSTHYQIAVAKTIDDDGLKLRAVEKIGGDCHGILITIQDEKIRQTILKNEKDFYNLRDFARKWDIKELQDEFNAFNKVLDESDIDKQMDLFHKTEYYPIKKEIARLLVRKEKIDEIKKVFPYLVSGLGDADLRDLISDISYLDEEGFIQECISNEDVFNKVLSSTTRYQDIEGIILKLDSDSKFKLLKSVFDKTGDQRVVSHYIYDQSNPDETLIKEFDLIFRTLGFSEEEIPEKVDILKGMYKTNSDVIRNLNYKLLDDKFLDSLGVEKINLISCYLEIQNKIIRLSPKKLDVFVKSIDDYMGDAQTEEWTTIANSILDNLCSNEYDDLVESIDDIEKVDIDILKGILQGRNVFNIKNQGEIAQYEKIKKQKTDSWIKSSDIEDKKLAVLEKVFGHDVEYAKEILTKYGQDIDSLPDSDMKYYIKSVQEIMNCTSGEIFEKIYDECKEVTFVDKALTERSLKTEFGKLYNEGLLNVDNCEFMGENMYLAGTDFKMIITSVGAYIQSNYDNNYKKDWNRPALASQHFCASYIRNDMIGTAPISDICYGFDEMEEDSLVLSGANDVWSTGAESFVSRASCNETYYTPDEQINNTTRYNEMDFRRIQNGQKKQPSYIVVFKRNGEIPNLENAKRAQKDWGGLPIVVVDVDVCLESEKCKVDSMIQQYRESKDPELAKEIYNKIRNNRVTEKQFCEDIDIEQFKVEEQEIQTEQIVTESDLEENYNLVTSQERNEQISKMKGLFSRICQIKQEDRDIG